MAASIAGVVLALMLRGVIAPQNPSLPVVPDSSKKTAISGDAWYDASDPSLIVGDSFFVIVGQAQRTIRVDGDRTVYEVKVTEELKGETPEVILVSQIGYEDGENTWELEGYPLMKPGRSYIMSLTAPAEHEAQDALVLLSGQGMGNKVEVSGPEDPLVAWYKTQVGRARSPYSRGASTFGERIRDGRRWQNNHPGYRASQPPEPKQ